MATRRWIKIGAGLGATIIFLTGFFATLTLLYNFEIIDLTGNITCEGSYENPCISFFDVKNPKNQYVDIYNKNQTKLEFSPQIKDYALFVPDGRCSATGKCACTLKDGSKLGAKGWRCVDFTNATKPRQDKAYNFRFPAYSTTHFLLMGIKDNPSDTVKWGFGVNKAELDPVWKGFKLTIISDGMDFSVKKFAGVEDDLFRVEVEKIDEVNSNICILPKEPMRFNDKNWKDLVMTAKKTDVPLAIDIKSNLVVTQKGQYIESACLFVDNTVVDLQIGTNSIEIPYENQYKINYNDGERQINSTLYCDGYRINNVTVDGLKFGGNIHTDREKVTCTYSIDSSADLWQEEDFIYYSKEVTPLVETTYQGLDLNDICGNQECQYDWNYKTTGADEQEQNNGVQVNITFIAGNNQDGVISIDPFYSTISTGLSTCHSFNNTMIDLDPEQLYNGTTVNNPTYIPDCKVGGCYYLNGTSYLTVNNGNVDFDVGAVRDDFVVTMWIKLNKTGRQFLMNQRADSSNFNELEIQADNSVRWRTKIGGGAVEIQVLSNNDVLTTDTWHHIGVVIDRDSTAGTKIYIDGVDETNGTSTTSTTDITVAAAMEIGRWSGGGYYLNGSVDEFKYWETGSSGGSAYPNADYNRGDGISCYNIDEEFSLYAGLNNIYLGNNSNIDLVEGATATLVDTDYQDLAKEAEGFQLNGASSSYLNLNWGNGIDPSEQSFTLCAWSLLNATGTSKFIFSTGQAGAGAPNNRFYAGPNYAEGKWDMGIHTSAWGLGATVDILPKEPAFICAVMDSFGDDAYLYINGVESRTKSYGSYVLGNDIHVGVHPSSNASWWYGYVDEILLWKNRALTQTEVQRLYNERYYGLRLSGIDENDNPQSLVNYPSANANFPEGATNVTINFSITEPNLVDITYDWNGTNYTIFDEDVVLFMDFEGGNGRYIQDSSDWKHNGITYSTEMSYDDGKYGNGLVFDGSANYVILGDMPQLDMNATQNFTLSTWIKDSFVGTTTYVFASGQGGAGDAWYGLILNQSGNVFFQVDDGSNTVTDNAPTSIADGLWHLVVVTVDQTTDMVKIWIDGKLDSYGTDMSSVGDMTNDENKIIGRRSTLYLNATLDNFMIIKKALTAEEIRLLYHTGLRKINKSGWSLSINQTDISSLLNDLTHCYSFDEDSDDSILGWNGADTSITYPGSNFGNASEFDGSSSHIDLTGVDTWDTMDGTTGLTFDTYIKVDNVPPTNNERIIHKWRTNGDNRVFAVGLKSDNKIVATFSADGTSSNYGTFSTDINTISDTNWHRLTITTDFTADSYNIYWDRVNVTNSSAQSESGTGFPSTLPSKTSTLSFGGNSELSTWLDGSLDEFKIWRRAFTPTEIQLLDKYDTCDEVLNRPLQNGTYDYNIYTEDYYGNTNSTGSNLTVGAVSEAGADSCDTTDIDCSDGCVYSSAKDGSGGTITATGPGTIYNLRKYATNYVQLQLRNGCKDVNS